MDYYKVMLVDDEEEVREAMMRRIDWEAIGFKVISTAENGEEALELAEKNPPDVVLTDIKMPFMDGLTMLHKLKSIVPGVKSVIFSGFDEFEYAKEAIKLEAEEYILKPIDAEELKQVFIRIKEHLDEELLSKRDTEKLKQYYQQSLPVLKEQFLVGLLEGRLSEAKIKHYVAEYDFDLNANHFCVAVLNITPASYEDELSDTTLLSLSLKQLTDENLADTIRATSINYLDTIAVVARLADDKEYRKFIACMDRVCKLSKRMLFGVTFAGISRMCDTPKQIAQAFNEAKDAASYRIFLDENQAILITDVEPGERSEDFAQEKQISRILHEIKVGTKESLTDKINEAVASLKEEAAFVDYLQIFYTEFLVEISRLARGHKMYAQAAEFMDVDVKKILSECKDLNDFAKQIYKDCCRIKGGLEEDRVNVAKQITNKARAYIEENFARSDLSLDEMCNYLNVSTTYFSALFKKETGKSFVTYLTEFRMNEATKLLDTTNEKSYIIAGMVGYDEPNYFSYVFKKQFGVSPSKYRQR